MNENSYAALLSPIVTRDCQRKRSAEPKVLIDQRPESRSFHIFYRIQLAMSLLYPCCTYHVNSRMIIDYFSVVSVM